MTEINYFDIHSHLHSDFFQADSKEIIKKMKEEKIWTILVGVDYKDSKKAVSLANKHKNLYSTIGIHPTTKERFDKEKFQKLLKSNEKIVGIGECGLDYYWPMHDFKKFKINEKELADEKKRQKVLFEQQIDFALKNNLPMMLHVRPHKNSDAYIDAFKILDQYKDKKLKINFHFFTDTPKTLKEIKKRNFSISLPGVITFADLDRNIREAEIENIMSETDSPFATPIPYRGKINTPLYIPKVVDKIADIKKIEVKKIVVENALKFWNIKN